MSRPPAAVEERSYRAMTERALGVEGSCGASAGCCPSHPRVIYLQAAFAVGILKSPQNSEVQSETMHLQLPVFPTAPCVSHVRACVYVLLVHIFKNPNSMLFHYQIRV